MDVNSESCIDCLWQFLRSLINFSVSNFEHDEIEVYKVYYFKTLTEKLQSHPNSIYSKPRYNVIIERWL